MSTGLVVVLAVGTTAFLIFTALWLYTRGREKR